MREARPAGLAGSPVRPLWRLTGALLLLAAVVALPFVIWGEHFNAMLGQGRLLEWFAEYRRVAWLVGIALLVSDLLLPIPNTMVMATLGVLYGPVLGGLVSVIGNCLSGLLGYSLCRRFGRPVAKRLLGEADLSAGEYFFAHSGGWMVAGSRWMPVFPEVIACMAGLARMPVQRFLLALFCGSVPLGFAVAALGYAGSDRPVMTIALCALLPLPIWYLLRPAVSATP